MVKGRERGWEIRAKRRRDEEKRKEGTMNRRSAIGYDEGNEGRNRKKREGKREGRDYRWKGK